VRQGRTCVVDKAAVWEIGVQLLVLQGICHGTEDGPKAGYGQSMKGI
jgi:hypothetical protein